MQRNPALRRDGASGAPPPSPRPFGRTEGSSAISTLRRVPRTTTVTDKTYRAIKRAIVQNEFAPGYALNTEVLARRLGVSRTPVRDALLMLKQEGLVEGEGGHGRNLYVAGLLLEELQEIFELRLAIETGALRLLERNGRLQDTRALEAHLLRHRRPEGAAASDAASRADLEFHRKLVSATRNSQFVRTWDQLATQLSRYWDAGRAVPGRAHDDIEECLDIVQAMKNGDANGAIERLERHLDHTQRAIHSWHERRHHHPHEEESHE